MSFGADENGHKCSGVEIIEEAIKQWQIINRITDDQIFSISFTDLIVESEGMGFSYSPRTHEVRARLAYKV